MITALKNAITQISGNFCHPCPVFLSHQSGDRVSSGFTLLGLVAPRQQVQVLVISRPPALGGLIGFGEQTLVNREITTDDSGRFQVEVPQPTLSSPRTRYTVYAYVKNDQGGSQIAHLNLKQAQRSQSRPLPLLRVWRTLLAAPDSL